MKFLLCWNTIWWILYLNKLGRNAVHGSDSYEAAGREIDLLFPTITGKPSSISEDLNICRQQIPLQATRTGSTLEAGFRMPSRRSEKSKRPILQGDHNQVWAKEHFFFNISHQVCGANTPAGLDCDVSDEARWTASMVNNLDHIQSIAKL